MCSVLSALVSLACFIVIGIAIFLILRYAVNKAGLDDEVQDIGDALQDKLNELFKKNDPYTGNNDTQVWRNKGKGLELTLLNALSEDWYPYFNQAISDWDSGSPDTMTLSSEIITAEKDCTPVDGVMKVCNGDYGETGWKGINKILMDTLTNRIVTSTALMNEFYLTSSIGADDKQYTMCHEIGHGFGLPHTDENFYNKDTYNCLDYTMKPGDNKLPGVVNFNRLATMYGSVDGSIKPSDTGATSSSTTSSNSNSTGSNSTSTGDDSGTTSEQSKVEGNRNLQKSIQQQQQPYLRVAQQYDTSNDNSNTNGIPNWIIDATKEIDTIFQQHQDRRRISIKYDSSDASNGSQSSIRYHELVHTSDYGEAHVFYLDQDYKIHVHVLNA